MFEGFKMLIDFSKQNDVMQKITTQNPEFQNMVETHSIIKKLNTLEKNIDILYNEHQILIDSQVKYL